MKNKIIISMVLLLIGGLAFSFWLISRGSNATKPGYSGQKLQVVAPQLLGQTAFRINVVIPDGWIVDKKSLDEGLLFVNELRYSPGNQHTFTTAQNVKDIYRFMLSWELASDFAKEYAAYQKTDWGKVSGISVTLYFHEFNKGETIGNVTMQGGEKEYMYYFIKDDEALQVSYFVLPGDEDQKLLIENVVRSISF